MLRSLFARLTANRDRGQALFESLVDEARRPHWYVEGKVADTIDGRFDMLATVTALAIVRLDMGGAEARAQSVSVTERFIATLDTELRQLGVSDPSLGKQVRRLVRSLERRVGLWRQAVESDSGWNEAAERSVYRGEPPAAAAAKHVSAQLRRLWTMLQDCDDRELIEGRIG
ncbi:MAG TPA: ubiquinol-cytochrome C chaperone family protein [Sphingomicrobium sp.]|nr:ubiquinol-cytochrome C chaperone family protein [Sphingomicrobium sp.]